MKGKQLFILLVLAALAGGAWYLLTPRNGADWSATGGGGGKVLDFPLNEVTRIVIKDASGEVNLVRKDDVWTVQERADYPANFEQVAGLLRKVWELKTVQEVKVGASQLPRLELVEPGQGDKTGTLVQFLGADGKALNALLLGKSHLQKSEGVPGEGFPAGRYVKPASSPKVSLVSERFDDAVPKPERWLAKDFLKIEGPKSIAVAGPTDAQKWTMSRENASAEWKLADGKPEEKVDAGKTAPLSTVLFSSAFNDVLAPDAKPEETGLDKPTAVTIETFDGFRYDLKIGKESGDNFPIAVNVSANFAKERTPGKDEKPEDKAKLDEEFTAKQKTLEEKLAREKKFEGRAYLIAKFSVESLLKDRAAWLADKPAEPATAPPATGAATPPPSSATTPPITVTTPPISIPPAQPAPPAPSAPPTPPPAESATPPAPKPAGQPSAPPAPTSVTTPPVSIPPAEPATPTAPPAPPMPPAAVPVTPPATPAKKPADSPAAPPTPPTPNP